MECEAILKFRLPEQGHSFQAASNATSLSCALWDMDQWLRGEIKYKDRDWMQEVRDKLNEFMDDHNIRHIVFEE